VNRGEPDDRQAVRGSILVAIACSCKAGIERDPSTYLLCRLICSVVA